MNSREGRTSMEILVALGFLVVWIILQVWVLPKMGIRT
jgi:hypothetical protein